MKIIVDKADYEANGDRKIEALNAARFAFSNTVAVKATSIVAIDGAYEVWAIGTDADVTILVWFNQNHAIVKTIAW